MTNVLPLNSNNPKNPEKPQSQELPRLESVSALNLNDVQIRAKEEKSKTFVLVKEEKHGALSNRRDPKQSEQKIADSNKRTEEKFDKKPEIRIKRQERSAEKKIKGESNNDVSSNPLKSKSQSPERDNSELKGKTHLFKLKDPIEIPSLAIKRSDNEIETPQGRSRHSQKHDDDTDSLVLPFGLPFLIFVDFSFWPSLMQ